LSYVWLNSDAERNLCVLINQIPSERKLYSELVDMKEEILRSEIKGKVELLGYEVVNGKVTNTDVDLAILDHMSKICLCVELKWFIEPAEVREVLERSEEIKKGISQAKKIMNLFENEDAKLCKELLRIDKGYKLFAIVGSRTFIGEGKAQDGTVPVVKVGHLLENLEELGNLAEFINWLKERKYLPVRDVDFEVVERDLSVGEWTGGWYGLRLLD